MTTPSGSPEVQRAMAALLSICPRHVEDGRAVVDLDCGDCGSRQEAAQRYMLSIIEEAQEALLGRSDR